MKTPDELNKAWREALPESFTRARRERVLKTVVEFRGASDGETLSNLAGEIIRLRFAYRELIRAIEEVRAGRKFHIMREGPLREQNDRTERTKDAAVGFYDTLTGPKP